MLLRKTGNWQDRAWVLERELLLTQELLTLAQAKLSIAETRILAQKEDLDRVLAHNRALVNQPVPQRSDTPLYMSETEEDIRFMRDNQLIGIDEAEDMLRELDFDNPDIMVEI